VEPKNPIIEADLWKVVYQALDFSIDHWYDHVLIHRDDRSLNLMVIDPETIHLGTMWNKMTELIVFKMVAKMAGLKQLTILRKFIQNRLRIMDEYDSLTSSDIEDMSPAQKGKLRQRLMPEIENVHLSIWNRFIDGKDAALLREKIRISVFTVSEIEVTANLKFRILDHFMY